MKLDLQFIIYSSKLTLNQKLDREAFKIRLLLDTNTEFLSVQKNTKIKMIIWLTSFISICLNNNELMITKDMKINKGKYYFIVQKKINFSCKK